MNKTLQTILNRRSIRMFKQEQIKDEELQSILESGRFAPSGMNKQPWHFTVIQNENLLNRVNIFIKESIIKSDNNPMAKRAKAENFSIFYNAPMLIIASGDEKVSTAQFDCTLALGNMFLASESLEIGSCWIHAISVVLNTEQGRALIHELGIPDGYIAFASGAFGYKATESPSPAPRKEGTVNIIK